MGNAVVEPDAAAAACPVACDNGVVVRLINVAACRTNVADDAARVKMEVAARTALPRTLNIFLCFSVNELHHVSLLTHLTLCAAK